MAPFAANYIRRKYRRRIGNALYRRTRRSLAYRGRHLRGSAKRRITSASTAKKRKWASAMGATQAPSARTVYRHSRYYSQLGLRPGSHASRRYKVGEVVDSDKFDKELHAIPLVNAQYSDTDDVMNRRHGRLCNVKGTKIRLWFNVKNQAESTTKMDKPLQIRWAIINPRDQDTSSVLDVTIGTNFFVSDTPAADDASDFPPTGSCLVYMNRKINRRKYGVVQEGTFTLQNDVASNNSRIDQKAQKFLSLWCPINRQMKWPNNSAGESGQFPSHNLYFVYWYCQQGDIKSTKTFTTANDVPIDVLHETVTYFKDAEALR